MMLRSSLVARPSSFARMRPCPRNDGPGRDFNAGRPRRVSRTRPLASRARFPSLAASSRRCIAASRACGMRGVGTAAQSISDIDTAGAGRQRPERRVRLAHADRIRPDHELAASGGTRRCGHRFNQGHVGALIAAARQVTTSMTINATAIILLSLYAAVATSGRGPPDLGGTVQTTS